MTSEVGFFVVFLSCLREVSVRCVPDYSCHALCFMARVLGRSAVLCVESASRVAESARPCYERERL